MVTGYLGVMLAYGAVRSRAGSVARASRQARLDGRRHPLAALLGATPDLARDRRPPSCSRSCCSGRTTGMSSSQHPRSRGSDWLALGRAQIQVPIGIAAAYDGPVLGRFARAAAGPSARRRCRSAACRRSSFGQGGEQGRGRPRFSSPASPARAQASGVPRDRPRPGGAGHLAIVAEPEGLAAGELTPAAVDRPRLVEEVLCRPDAARGSSPLLGVSGGGTLALLDRSRSAPHGTGVDRPRTRPVVRRRGGDSGRHDGRLPGRIRARAVRPVTSSSS